MKVNNTDIVVVRGSVTDQDVDVIVNAANTSMRGGGGVDGLIHRLAGKELMVELIEKAPHGAKTGTVVITKGFNLKQPYIIHTPGPVWSGGNRNEPELLSNSYKNSLIAADTLKLSSIAFCSISTGVYRFPKELASKIAVKTAIEYCKENEQTSLKNIIFAMYGEEEFQIFSDALGEAEA